MLEVTEQVAPVTGAGSGIGRAGAHLFACQRAKVVVSDGDENGGVQTVEMIRQANGEAVFVRADVSDPKDCRAVAHDRDAQSLAPSRTSVRPSAPTAPMPGSAVSSTRLPTIALKAGRRS